MNANSTPAAPAAVHPESAMPVSTATHHYRFKPLNVGRMAIWSAFALLLIVAPLLFTSSLALTMLSQIGYLIIICLSYNILLGHGRS